MSKDWFIKIRGYFYVVFLASLFAGLSTWKYVMVSSKNWWFTKIAALFGINFIVLIVPGLLLVRWYYKLKTKQKHR